jgi:signal peptidase II
MLNKLHRNWLIAIIALITIILDQLTKVVARKSLSPLEELSYLGNTFVLQHTENTGAFLSLGSDLPEGVRFLIFSVLVGAGLVYVTYSLVNDKTMELHETIAWSMIIGGGFGNLIDRVFRGSVTDFLNLGIGNIRTGIFNIADVAVTTGAILLFLSALNKKFGKKKGTP